MSGTIDDVATQRMKTTWRDMAAYCASKYPEDLQVSITTDLMNHGWFVFFEGYNTRMNEENDRHSDT